MGPYGVSAELTALVALAILVLVMRWVFGRPKRIRHRPVDASESGDLGLLTVIASGLTRHDATRRQDVLRGAHIRSSVSLRSDGTVDLLVFSGDVQQARVLLGP